MKILHIIYSSGIYGAEKHLLDLLPALKKYDINCDLVFICPEHNALSFELYFGELNKRGIRTTLFTVKSKAYFLSTARKIYKYLQVNSIHIIHSHLFNADFIAVLIKKFFFKKLVILSTKHGYEENYLVQYGLGNRKIRYNLYYFISQQINKRIDHKLTISNALADMYLHLKLSKSKMKYIHHGITPKAFNLEKGDWVEGAPKIMIVGRLSEMKGHEYLIKALPRIIEEFPDLQLIVLGEGELKDKLKVQSKSLKVDKHINFVGFASPESYIPQCQLMVLPSLFEPFGLVYIESFASKIPVVAFNTQAANEIIEDNKTGVLVKEISADQLAEKIIYLLQSPDLRNTIIDNSYKKYITYFNVERMAKETAEWYGSIIDATNLDSPF